MLLVGTLAALVLTGRVWVRADAQDPVLGTVDVLRTGAQTAPATSALALAALAAVLLVLLVRGLPRRIALALLVLAGAGSGWLTGVVLVDPAAALAGAGAAELPLGSAGLSGATATWAPWAHGAAVVVWMGGAVLTARRAPVRPGGGTSPDDGIGSGPDDGTGPVVRAAADLPESERVRRREALTWEELSAGQDPTDHGRDDPAEDHPEDTGPGREDGRPSG